MVEYFKLYLIVLIKKNTIGNGEGTEQPKVTLNTSEIGPSTNVADNTLSLLGN